MSGSGVDPKDDLTALGNVAKIFAGVSGEQVEQACAYAQREDVRLGDALVAEGALDGKQRDAMVSIQRKLRKGTAPAQVAQMVRFVTQRSVEVLERIAQALDDATEMKDEGEDDDEDQ